MSLAALKTVDVDRRRAERLRSRCHASLRAQSRRASRPAVSDRKWIRRAIASGASCI